MADDDRAAARAALAAEAARLKAQREEAAARRKADEAERRRGAGTFRSKHFRRAFRGEFLFFGGLSLLIVGALLTFVRDEDSHAMSVVPEGFAMLLAGALVLAWHYSGHLRFYAWRRRQPFTLDGWEEALGGEAVTEAELEIVYADTGAPKEQLAELVRARMKEDSDDPKTEVASARAVRAKLFTSASNLPASSWARKVVTRVLREVHRGYAMKAVKLRALQRGEYDYGSGD